MKRVLITGASGFLGKYISNHLPPSQYMVYQTYLNNRIPNGYRVDLTRPLDAKYISRLAQADIVIHCAANPSPKHPEDHKKFLEDHILTTTNLLENCKEGCHFIYISSILVYGDSFPAQRTSNLYGACKASCEQICQAYSSLKNLKLNIIRPCAIVGKGLTHGLLYDIQRKLKLESEELELFGDRPGTCKPFVHIEDVYYLINKMINFNGHPSDDDILEIMDCFPQDSLTVEQVANIVMDTVNIKKPIKWLGKNTIWKGDNELIKTDGWQMGGFKVSYTSAEAIARSVGEF